MVGLPEYWAKEDVFNAYELGEFTKEQRSNFQTILSSNPEIAKERELYENMMKFFKLLTSKEFNPEKYDYGSFILSLDEEIQPQFISMYSQYETLMKVLSDWRFFMPKEIEEKYLLKCAEILNLKELNELKKLISDHSLYRSTYRVLQFIDKVSLDEPSNLLKQ